MGRQWKQWRILFFWAPKSLQMVIAAMRLKDAYSLEGSYDQPREHIKKQRHYFANKCPLSRLWFFQWSCMDVRVGLWRKLSAEKLMLWTVVLEKTLGSPLDCKEIPTVHLEGDQSCVFIGRTDAEAETPVLWPPDAKSWLIARDRDAWKDWGQEEKGTTGWDGWMASPTRWTCLSRNSRSLWWTGSLGVLQFMGSQSQTRQSDWTELNWSKAVLRGKFISI